MSDKITDECALMQIRYVLRSVQNGDDQRDVGVPAAIRIIDEWLDEIAKAQAHPTDEEEVERVEKAMISTLLLRKPDVTMDDVRALARAALNAIRKGK